MGRIKIDLPSSFLFTTQIPVRITDINYGGHVGNDTILTVIHEARMQFLRQYGCTEMNFGGVGLIMSDVGIEFRNELFYGDALTVAVTTEEISKISFAVYYKLEKLLGEKRVLVAAARTGMVCYNYTEKKVAPFPDALKSVFTV